MYFGQVTRYDILNSTNQLAKVMSKLSKAHMTAVKHLRCYLAGTTDFSITYKQGGFKLTAFWTQTGVTTWTTACRHPRLCSSWLILRSVSSPRIKHVALRYFFVEKLMREGRTSIQAEDQLADIGIKHLNKQRHRYFLKADQRGQGLKLRVLHHQRAKGVL